MLMRLLITLLASNLSLELIAMERPANCAKAKRRLSLEHKVIHESDSIAQAIYEMDCQCFLDLMPIDLASAAYFNEENKLEAQAGRFIRNVDILSFTVRDSVVHANERIKTARGWKQIAQILFSIDDFFGHASIMLGLAYFTDDDEIWDDELQKMLKIGKYHKYVRIKNAKKRDGMVPAIFHEYMAFNRVCSLERELPHALSLCSSCIVPSIEAFVDDIATMQNFLKERLAKRGHSYGPYELEEIVETASSTSEDDNVVDEKL